MAFIYLFAFYTLTFQNHSEAIKTCKWIYRIFSVQGKNITQNIFKMCCGVWGYPHWLGDTRSYTWNSAISETPNNNMGWSEPYEEYYHVTIIYFHKHLALPVKSSTSELVHYIWITSLTATDLARWWRWRWYYVVLLLFWCVPEHINGNSLGMRVMSSNALSLPTDYSIKKKKKYFNYLPLDEFLLYS